MKRKKVGNFLMFLGFVEIIGYGIPAAVCNDLAATDVVVVIALGIISFIIGWFLGKRPQIFV